MRSTKRGEGEKGEKSAEKEGKLKGNGKGEEYAEKEGGSRRSQKEKKGRSSSL